MNPPNSRSSSAANLIGVRSSRYGPIAWSPIGSPARVSPTGNAVAGCLQGIAMADLLDEASLAVLRAPWLRVTGAR